MESLSVYKLIYGGCCHYTEEMEIRNQESDTGSRIENAQARSVLVCLSICLSVCLSVSHLFPKGPRSCPGPGKNVKLKNILSFVSLLLWLSVEQTSKEKNQSPLVSKIS